jgi:hypothetical protein
MQQYIQGVLRYPIGWVHCQRLVPFEAELISSLTQEFAGFVRYYHDLAVIIEFS